MDHQLDTKEIQKIIPHRYPMLLIDKVIELEAGKRAQTVHSITNNEIFVAANKIPSFPRLLIIEALAQTGAVALLSEEKFAGKTAYFGGIRKAEFFDEAYAGRQLVLTTKLTKIRGSIGVGEGQAKIGNELIAQAELTFMIG